MELVAFLLLPVVAVIAWLSWTRRHGNSGLRDTDPQANRNIAKHGGQPLTNPIHRPDDFPGGGSI